MLNVIKSLHVQCLLYGAESLFTCINEMPFKHPERPKMGQNQLSKLGMEEVVVRCLHIYSKVSPIFFSGTYIQVCIGLHC